MQAMALFRRHRRFLIVMFGVVLVLFAGIQWRAVWLKQYALFYTVSNARPGADAIIVLSGGQLSRIPKALQLYQQGYAPKLLLTDAKPVGMLAELFPGDLQVARLIMEKSGVIAPIEMIPSLKDGAVSTFDEAADTRDFALKSGIKRLIIVTDAFHSRRAFYAFSKILSGSGINVEVAAASNEIFNEENWWHSDIGISAYVQESIKYPVYLMSSRNSDLVKNY